MNYLFGVLVIMILVITMGCTQQQTTNQTVVPTASITPSIAPTVITTTLVIETPPPDVTTQQMVVVTQTSIPEQGGPITIITDPDPFANTTLSSFTANGSYKSSDFSVITPDNWTVSEIVGNATNLHSSGPDLVNPVNRIVTITSPDGVTNFTGITSDLVIPGHYDPLLTIEDCRNTITPQFPDVSGRTALVRYDYLHTVLGTPYAQFDVVIPKVSTFYPLEYTERDLASYSHVYVFRFSTTGNMTAEKEIKDTMFASLVTEERVKRVAS